MPHNGDPMNPVVSTPTHLRRSDKLVAFAHMGDVYLFHDRFGYILKMSPDVLAFLDAFEGGADCAAVCAKWATAFEGQTPEEFVDVFFQFSCLVESVEAEREEMWFRVPVKGRWNVWRREEDKTITLFCAWGSRPLTTHRLSAEETAVWDAIDGDTTMMKLRQEFGADAVIDLVERLVPSEVQALKLSHVPMSTYAARPQTRPPYLTSTMPYERYRPEHDPRPEGFAGEFSPQHYYEQDVADADAQFDDKETTLSHLLRMPHPAIAGRTYGAALVDVLAERGKLPAERIRVLEIGGGLGYCARDIANALAARGLEVSYDILELSPALAAAQRARCEGLPVTVREGSVFDAAIEAGVYDLLLANEMMGDLTATELTHADIAMEGTVEQQAASLGKLGEAGRLIDTYELALHDAPDPFYLNTGALQLVERAWKAIAAGGVGILTEFGEPHMYPRLSTQLDHPELSIHFAHLERVAQKVGFDAKIEFVIDLLDFDRTLEGMVTTRSYFRALRAMLSEHGVELQKVGYTRSMFEAEVAGKIAIDRIGSLYFDRIEDRLMGLVPHEFKALMLVKPTG